jgi:hypothetical protein
MFADLDPGERRTQVWSAIRVFYNSDAPTGDEAERDDESSDPIPIQQFREWLMRSEGKGIREFQRALTEHGLIASAGHNPEVIEAPFGVVEINGLLVGTAEAAAILEVERPRIGRWRKLDNGKLPPPVAQLASGPVWLRSQIEDMRASTMARKRPRATPQGE